MSDSAIRKAYSVVLGTDRPTIAMWPVMTGVGSVAGTLLTPGAAAWGAYADIIAAAAIATEFWCLEAVFTVAAGAFGVREVQIWNATAGVFVYCCRVHVTAATMNLAPFPIPIPVHCNAKAQIQGRSGATNAADTTRCSLLVATGV